MPISGSYNSITSGGGHVSLSQGAEVHGINNFVVLIEHCVRSTVAVRFGGVKYCLHVWPLGTEQEVLVSGASVVNTLSFGSWLHVSI